MNAFFTRLEGAAESAGDAPAGNFLEPGCRWNGLINALSTYISGAEWDRVSTKDFDRYHDTGVNWRVVKGYGALIRTCGENLPAELDCAVRAIDHRGKRLRIETAKGTIAADHVIVTIPSTLIAAERLLFTPALPEKTEAARGLPLGLADKLFVSLERAEEFEQDTRVFGHTDRAATATYQFRPFGRPMIEVYFGGRFAAELEAGGDGAFFECAVSDLVGLFGSAFAARIKPIGIHRWGVDPFSLGSYSYASPGFADCRPKLAEPVDGRLFFAGEACSVHDFSTAHGGWHTGVSAAEQVIAARRTQSPPPRGERAISSRPTLHAECPATRRIGPRPLPLRERATQDHLQTLPGEGSRRNGGASFLQRPVLEPAVVRRRRRCGRADRASGSRRDCR